MPYDYVIGADIIYPHEHDADEAMAGLVATMKGLISGDTIGLIHHTSRGSDGERSFFFDLSPKFVL